MFGPNLVQSNIQSLRGCLFVVCQHCKHLVHNNRLRILVDNLFHNAEAVLVLLVSNSVLALFLKKTSLVVNPSPRDK